VVDFMGIPRLVAPAEEWLNLYKDVAYYRCKRTFAIFSLETNVEFQ